MNRIEYKTRIRTVLIYSIKLNSTYDKGSKLPLNKGFENMFELLQSCAQPSDCRYLCNFVYASPPIVVGRSI